MRNRRFLRVAGLLALPAWIAFGQANGKLQIHFMDVGQGDGAVLISPGGEIVLFDDGVMNNCTKPVSYLQKLKIEKIDYHITSHYHSDHIGCAKPVFEKFPLQKDAFDRGGSYQSSIFDAYVTAVGSHRKTATEGMKVTLDDGSSTPVNIHFVALNGNGVETTNENDLSLVAVVRFGNFDAEIGGDLSGIKTDNYEDIETDVAPKVGPVEVYKVHHHGSRYSSNDAWVSTIKPLVGIISTGKGNRYNHPTQECLDRLHAASIKTYWTEEGNGADPDSKFDTVVNGSIVVEVAPGADSFTVNYGGKSVPFPISGATAAPEVASKFSWSGRSNIYHFTNCQFVRAISASNLQQGNEPPEGKSLHKGCPR